jgi:hypothetical protein
MVIRYLLADALSLFGNAVAGVALPWLVLVRTGDAAAAGSSPRRPHCRCCWPRWSGAGWSTGSVAVGSRSAPTSPRRPRSRRCPLVDASVGLTLSWFIVLGVAGALFDVPGMTAREALGPDVARAAGGVTGAAGRDCARASAALC